MASNKGSGSSHVEPHIKESNYIRDLVFGFGDGVNTSLGIVAGVGGAIISADVVILAALIGMFTGAKAMASSLDGSGPGSILLLMKRSRVGAFDVAFAATPDGFH